MAQYIPYYHNSLAIFCIRSCRISINSRSLKPSAKIGSEAVSEGKFQGRGVYAGAF